MFVLCVVQKVPKPLLSPLAKGAFSEHTMLLLFFLNIGLSDYHFQIIFLFAGLNKTELVNYNCKNP